MNENIKTDDKLKFHVYEDERNVDMNIYQFGWERTKSLHSFGPYIRNHYLFHFVFSGKGQLTVNNHTYNISAGNGFLIFPDEITSYIADEHDPWEYAWIELDGILVGRNFQFARLDSSQPVYRLRSKNNARIIEEQMMQIIDNPDESTAYLLGQSFLLFDLLIKHSANQVQKQSGSLAQFYINEAIIYIEQNYDKFITVEDIADACNLSREYFSKIFKRHMQVAPQEFLINYRMSKAATLLIDTDLSIFDISQQIGYPNQSHFTRSFKSVYGIAPKFYRDKNKTFENRRNKS